MQPPYTAPATEEAVTRVIAFFENLSPADVATIGQFYAPQARFKDPFNEVRGLAAIEGRIGKALIARSFKLVLAHWRDRDGQGQALPLAPV